LPLYVDATIAKRAALVVTIPASKSRQKGEHMGKLAWIELIVLWGFAVLVVLLDQKNLPIKK